jgi:metal-responsive CopG/Arc/MetJ family transcriptional regulator
MSPPPKEYNGSMKEKTSITLSSDLLAEIDRNAGSKASRSAFIEGVLREYFKIKVREAINARDLALINAHAGYLTHESRELDEFQAPIEWGNSAR